MPWKTSDPEWVPEEYPKMLTQKDEHGFMVPVVYPSGHAKQGRAVIFENKDEEKAYSSAGKKPAPPPAKGKKRDDEDGD